VDQQTQPTTLQKYGLEDTEPETGGGLLDVKRASLRGAARRSVNFLLFTVFLAGAVAIFHDKF